MQPEQVLNLETINGFWPGPVELIQGFQAREAGEFNAALPGPLLAQGGFAIDQGVEIIDVRLLIFCGVLGQGVEVFLNERQLQIIELLGTETVGERSKYEMS